MDQEFCIIHVSLFLAPNDIFTRLALASKQIWEVISDVRFIRYYLSVYFGTKHEFDLEELMLAWIRLRNPDILEFKPYYTDGGVSEIEYLNSFSSMWKYNGATFSTHYREGTGTLKKNVKCVGYFGGWIQDYGDFFSYFHHDFFNYRYNLENIPRKYSNFDISQLLEAIPFNPLHPEYPNLNPNDLHRIAVHPNTLDEDAIHTPDELEIFYPYDPPQGFTAIVSAISIARPFYFTGSVRTLMIFLSNLDGTDISALSSSDRYDDLTDFEQAKNIRPCMKVKDSSKIRYLEYLGDPSKEFYPVLWVQFHNYLFNHLVIKLKKRYLVRRMYIKLIDIDDRRSDFGLERMEPNFDITYVLGLGGVVKM
jgi:hypothetical protein